MSQLAAVVVHLQNSLYSYGHTRVRQNTRKPRARAHSVCKTVHLRTEVQGLGSKAESADTSCMPFESNDALVLQR